MAEYLIGLTTGRSASKSLATFLDNQKHVNFSHEACGIPFWPCMNLYYTAVEKLKQRAKDTELKIIGDISPMWVMYVDRLVEDLDCRFIWIERGNLDQVVTSFDSYKRYERLPEKSTWWGNYPVFDKKYSVEAVRKAIYLTDWMLRCAEAIWGDRMAKLNMVDLNKQHTQVNLLNWLGIPEEDHVLGVTRENLRVDMVKNFKKLFYGE